jgi:hypothetical protein
MVRELKDFLTILQPIDFLTNYMLYLVPVRVVPLFVALAESGLASTKMVEPELRRALNFIWEIESESFSH